MEMEPHVELTQSGSYHIGLQQGDIDGRIEGEGRDGFSFEDMDEYDAMHGHGKLKSEGAKARFVLAYHQGDRLPSPANRDGLCCDAVTDRAVHHRLSDARIPHRCCPWRRRSCRQYGGSLITTCPTPANCGCCWGRMACLGLRSSSRRRILRSRGRSANPFAL